MISFAHYKKGTDAAHYIAASVHYKYSSKIRGNSQEKEMSV
jgi:hypothetical protein